MSVKYVVTIHSSDDKKKPVNAKIIDFTFLTQREADKFFTLMMLMKNCKHPFDHTNYTSELNIIMRNQEISLDSILKNHSRSFYVTYVRDVRKVTIKKQESK